MLTFTDEQIKDKIRADLGEAAGDAAQPLQFLPFSDLEASVRDDVGAIKASALVDKATPVTGYVYDVHTGKLNPVQ